MSNMKAELVEVTNISEKTITKYFADETGRMITTPRSVYITVKNAPEDRQFFTYIGTTPVVIAPKSRTVTFPDKTLHTRDGDKVIPGEMVSLDKYLDDFAESTIQTNFA